MNPPCWHRGEFGHVLADEYAVRIVALRLGDRVEYPEVGLGITTARCGPLPAPIVRCEVEIEQALGEVGFAAAPVDPQILAQERGHDHAQAVVHIAGIVELAHRGIDQRVPRFAGTPTSEQRLG